MYVTPITTTPDKFSASVRWYPEKDYLRVRTEVTDATFSTDSPEDKPWLKSCIEIIVSATGLDEDRCQFFIVPEGPGDNPRMLAVHRQSVGIGTEGMKAWWKRTEKGYVIDARIPWTKLPNYNKNWKTMPVELAVETVTLDGRVQMTMNGTKEPWRYAKGYAGLKRK